MEVIVITLPPEKDTAIHDHGQSIGCALIREGKLLNSIYKVKDDQYVERTTAYLVDKGECLYSSPGIIHKMSNSQH